MLTFLSVENANLNVITGTRLPDPRAMLDFGKRSTFIGSNDGSFLEDWRTCYVLVVCLFVWL